MVVWLTGNLGATVIMIVTMASRKEPDRVRTLNPSMVEMNVFHHSENLKIALSKIAKVGNNI